MLPYELVKTLHILSAFIFIAFAAMSLIGKPSRGATIAYGVGGVLTILFGFFLIGVLRQGMPHWMMGKFFIWLAVGALVGIVNKRFPKYKLKATYALFTLVGLAIYLAVYKPGP